MKRKSVPNKPSNKSISLFVRLFGNDEMRLEWLRITLILALIVGLLLSMPAWLSERNYPFVPLFSFIPRIPYPVDYILFFGLIFLLCLQIFFKNARVLEIVTFALIAFLAIADQSRWHVWVYQYFFMYGAFVFIRKQERATITLNVCRLIIICIYVWGGLQKINGTFFDAVFPWMNAPIISHLTFISPGFIHTLGYIAPFFEISLGIGLLFDRFRMPAIIAAIVMHSMILFSLGPFGHGMNTIVLPWNIAMICYLLILFGGVKGTSFKKIFSFRGSVYRNIVFILFAVMPLFSFCNLWDSYLSFSMYSGNTNAATIYIRSRSLNLIPPNLQKYLKPAAGGNYLFDVLAWGNGEMGVPIYPERRIFIAMKQYLYSYVGNGDLLLIIHGKPTLLNKDTTEFLR